MRKGKHVKRNWQSRAGSKRPEEKLPRVLTLIETKRAGKIIHQGHHPVNLLQHQERTREYPSRVPGCTETNRNLKDSRSVT